MGIEIASLAVMDARLRREAREFRKQRRIYPPPNPLLDPLRDVKRPLRALNEPFRGCRHLEFAPGDVQKIRRAYAATQRQFAVLIGISVETLRNWEKGRRSPHGPARALLRAIAAEPDALARVLNWNRVDWDLDLFDDE